MGSVKVIRGRKEKIARLSTRTGHCVKGDQKSKLDGGRSSSESSSTGERPERGKRLEGPPEEVVKGREEEAAKEKVCPCRSIKSLLLGGRISRD